MRIAVLIPAVLLLVSSAARAQSAADCSAPATTQAVNACVARELRESDARLNELYRAVMAKTPAANRAGLRSSQRDWIADRDSNCYVPTGETDRDGRPEPTRREFAATPESLAAQMATTTPDAKGKPRAPTRHMDGKWYFEVTIDRQATAQSNGMDVMAGFATAEGEFLGTSYRMRPSDRGEFTLGCAIDLDSGMVYFREGGSWNGKEPGSNRGLEVKLGREYLAQVRGSERIDNLLAAGDIRPNFGDTPFVYALPAGYRSWR